MRLHAWTTLACSLALGCASAQLPPTPRSKTPVEESAPTPTNAPRPQGAQAVEDARAERILRSSSLTRGDLAFLFAREFAPLGNGPAPESTALISDIEGYEGRSSVEETVRSGFMTVFPDGTFHPEDLVNRTQFALILYRILKRMVPDTKVSFPLPPPITPFPDVPSNHYAYRAITTVVSLKLLTPGWDQTFGVAEPLAGAEALEAMKVLKGMLR